MSGAETSLVHTAIALLKLKGVFCWRNNTGATVLGEGDGRRFVRFGVPGASDILGVLPGGRFFAAEAKVGRNKPTRSQQDFLNSVSRAGGLAIVFYSIDELIEKIREAKT